MDQLVDRVKNLLFSTVDTWREIKTENQESSIITRNYLVYIIALPAISLFIGHTIVGQYGQRSEFFPGLLRSILFFGLNIAVIYGGAYLVDLLAPTFSCQRNLKAAFQLVAYSLTAFYIAGIVFIIPALIPFIVAGFFGIYLFYMGVKEIMECPEDKAINYTIVSSIILFVLVVTSYGLAGLVD